MCWMCESLLRPEWGTFFCNFLGEDLQIAIKVVKRRRAKERERAKAVLTVELAR